MPSNNAIVPGSLSSVAAQSGASLAETFIGCDAIVALASEFRHAIGNRIVFVQAYEKGFVFCAQDHYGPEEVRYAEW